MKFLLPILLAGGIVAGVYPTLSTDTTEEFGLKLEACQEAMAAGNPGACELYGQIEIVDAHADVQVEEVSAHADIQVEWVDAFADSPGEWERVDAHADYQVEIVDAHADYQVEFVDNFPGCD